MFSTVVYSKIKKIMEIKQIPSKEVLGFLDSAEEKPYSLLDVRTPEEWNEIGNPMEKY